MARKVVVELVDDLTGDPIPDNGGETVTFSLDGKTYELDLTHDSSARMRDAMGVYVKAARPVGLGNAHTRGRRGTASRTDSDREKAKRIREWAIMRGLMKADSRGRIPGAIVEQWENRSAAEKVADDAKMRGMAGQQAIAEPGGTAESKPAPATFTEPAKADAKAPAKATPAKQQGKPADTAKAEATSKAADKAPAPA